MATRKHTPALQPRRPRPVALSSARRSKLATDVIDLAMAFAAVRRLAMEIEDGDKDLSFAAGKGVEALAILGGLRADNIANALGTPGVGNLGALSERE